uniref:Uncharacterized protein n=1 Tax=Oryza glumipatula TaxID=40148 RepID=A0A0E0BKA3_9ORYZ
MKKMLKGTWICMSTLSFVYPRLVLDGDFNTHSAWDSVREFLGVTGGFEAPQLGLNSFSPPALVAIPCGYCGEGCGCGERGPVAWAALKPPSLDLTHFRHQPLSLYLAGTVANGVGVAKGV